MAKIPPEKRSAKLKPAGMKSASALGQFNFRLEGEAIQRLSRVSELQGQAVSAMVRGWVLDRLDLEEEKAGLKEPQKPIWEAIADAVCAEAPGAFDNFPTDGALNHDHYLYGAPKKDK